MGSAPVLAVTAHGSGGLGGVGGWVGGALATGRGPRTGGLGKSGQGRSGQNKNGARASAAVRSLLQLQGGQCGATNY
jgi:hypothetical protein